MNEGGGASLPVKVLPIALLLLGALAVAQTLASQQAELIAKLGVDHIDLAVYRLGGQAVLEGLPLYDESLFPDLLPFTYTPFAAVLFIPLAQVPMTLGQAVMVAAGLACLAWAGWLIAGWLPRTAGRSLPWSRPGLAAALFGVGCLLQPTRLTLDLGQVNLILMAMLLADGLTTGKYRGFLSGLAAGIKIIPGVFVLAMAVERRWRDFVRGALGFILTVLVGAMVVPSDSWTFWTSEFFRDERQGSVTTYLNQSLFAEIARSTGASGGRALWVPVAGVVLVAGLAVAARLRERDALLATSAVGLTGLLASPISWDHHWVWLLPVASGLLAVGVRAVVRRAYAVAWLAFGVGAWAVVSGVVGPIALVGDQASPFASAVNWCLSNNLLLSGTGSLLALAVVGFRRDRLWGEATASSDHERDCGASSRIQ